MKAMMEIQETAVESVLDPIIRKLHMHIKEQQDKNHLKNEVRYNITSPSMAKISLRHVQDVFALDYKYYTMCKNC